MSGCLSDPKADYTLINIRRSIRLLSHHPRKREIDVVDFTFDYTKLPPDMHLFLVEEVPGAVFISGHLAVELAAIQPNNAVYFTVHDIKRSKGHSRALVAPKPKRR